MFLVFALAMGSVCDFPANMNTSCTIAKTSAYAGDKLCDGFLLGRLSVAGNGKFENKFEGATSAKMEWAECGKGIASCAHRYNSTVLANFDGIKGLMKSVPYTVFARCTGTDGMVFSYSVYITQWQKGKPEGSTRAYTYERTRMTDTGVAGVDQEAIENTKFKGNDARLLAYTIVYCILVVLVLLAHYGPGTTKASHLTAVVNVALVAWILQNVLTHAWHWEFEEQTLEDKVEYLGIEGADSNEVTIVNWSLCLVVVTGFRLRNPNPKRKWVVLVAVSLWVIGVNIYAWLDSFRHGVTQALELVGSVTVLVAWAYKGSIESLPTNKQGAEGAQPISADLPQEPKDPQPDGGPDDAAAAVPRLAKPDGGNGGHPIQRSDGYRNLNLALKLRV